MPLHYTPKVLSQGDYVKIGDKHYVVINGGLREIRAPGEPCLRYPRVGDVMGEICECGHTLLVHDGDGCGMCALREVIKAAKQ